MDDFLTVQTERYLQQGSSRLIQQQHPVTKEGPNIQWYALQAFPWTGAYHWRIADPERHKGNKSKKRLDMKKRLILKVLGLLLLLPMFSGCNDTDDVARIFTGKTWKLTYMTEQTVMDGITFWYSEQKATHGIYKRKENTCWFFRWCRRRYSTRYIHRPRYNQHQREHWVHVKLRSLEWEVEKELPYRQQRPYRRKILEGMRRNKFNTRIGQPELYLYYRASKEDLCYLVFAPN